MPLTEDFDISARHETTNVIAAALRILQAHIKTGEPFREFNGALVNIGEMDHFDDESDTPIPTVEELEALIDEVFDSRIPDDAPPTRSGNMLARELEARFPWLLAGDEDEQANGGDVVEALGIWHASLCETVDTEGNPL